jgi:hypothetical protein
MEANIRLSMTEYLAQTHAVTFDFGIYGKSVSKIEYYVNLV